MMTNKVFNTLNITIPHSPTDMKTNVLQSQNVPIHHQREPRLPRKQHRVIRCEVCGHTIQREDVGFYDPNGYALCPCCNYDLWVALDIVTAPVQLALL